MSKGINPTPRSFREGMFKFRTTPWDKLPTDDDLRRTIKGGLTNTAMGMFSTLNDHEVDAVIAYVKSFSRRWRRDENYADPLTFPTAPDWMDKAATRAPHEAPGIDGKGPTAPMLKDIWGMASIPSDLRQPHLRCGDGPEDIYRVLTTGLNGTPMISYAQTLTEQQRWQIIAYVMSKRIEGPPLLNPSSTTQASK